MLRRDLETFFLGTAMTISTTGRLPANAVPHKSYGRALRRGGPTSLAKSFRPRNNLAAAAGFVSQGRQTGKRMPPLLVWPPPALIAGASAARLPALRQGAGDRDRPPGRAVRRRFRRYRAYFRPRLRAST